MATVPTSPADTADDPTTEPWWYKVDRAALDDLLPKIAAVLAGIQVLSLGVPLGAAREPWTALHADLVGFGYGTAETYEDGLRARLEVPAEGGARMSDQIEPGEIDTLVEVFEASPDKLRRADLVKVAQRYRDEERVAQFRADEAFDELRDANRYGPATVVRNEAVLEASVRYLRSEVDHLRQLVLNLSEPAR